MGMHNHNPYCLTLTLGVPLTSAIRQSAAAGPLGANFSFDGNGDRASLALDIINFQNSQPTILGTWTSQA